VELTASRPTPRFWLGTHQSQWLGRIDVPLFISRRRLVVRSAMPRARGPWALDSGGFTELDLYGRWTLSPESYVAEVRHYRDTIGGLVWASVQDWMCEPQMLAKTGLGVLEHQARTIRSYLTLRELAPEISWTPVLQGWQPTDYLRHADAYQRAGIELDQLPIVGVGSVCRRQAMGDARTIVSRLHARGIRLHGFGFKLTGLRMVGGLLASSDSMAWSKAGRSRPPLPGCEHPSCGNCMTFALQWRDDVMGILAARPPVPFGAEAPAYQKYTRPARKPDPVEYVIDVTPTVMLPAPADTVRVSPAVVPAYLARGVRR
jgi:hypothetical protein